jgi:hypothetical protein
MYLSANETVTWPETVSFIGMMAFVVLLVGIAAAAWLANRKTKLAEKSLDAQQRTATDVSAMRSRTAAIEHSLRTAE